MVIEMDKCKDSKKLSREDLHRALAQRNACFVLITCSEPSPEGKMEVEMTCEGDPSLAAYLIESAHSRIEHQNASLSGSGLTTALELSQ
jgi:hypothetical protein